MLLRTIVICVFAIAVGSSAEDVDYCNPQLCSFGDKISKHVRCNNNGDFSKNCTGTYHLEDLTRYREVILDQHNYYRNLLASGKLTGFDSAVRMPAITEWDDDLATNAEYNVKSCVFAHDECRSTTKYKFVGQNIYKEITSNLSISIEEEIIVAVRLWFEEYHAANKELMQSFHKTIPQTGHFTLLMNDRVTGLGCAYLNNLQSNDGKHTKRMVIFTCDYTSTNIRDYPSYKAGPTAANCNRTHPKYSALCEDQIDSNDIYWYNS